MAKIKKIDDELNLASEARKTATDNLNNMSYDNFKQGSMYQGLQKSYSQQGQQAMKDTLGQVAARTGGMASSYATTAANQSYNNYMQQLEDVARAMYNDEYSKARDKVSLAQSEYDRLYGEKRDAITDQRYLTDKEEERVASNAYYGNASDYATYKANGGTLSEQAYNSIVAAAQGKYTDDHYEQNLTNKATKDSELKGIFGAEGFLWGDWDGDGKVGTEDTDGEVDADGNPITFEDLYGGSSYGEDYWKAYAENAAKENMKSSYSVEGVGRKFANEGADISDAGRAAIDYFFGPETANTVVGFIESIDFKAAMTDLEEDHHQAQHVDEFYELLPANVPSDLIYPYIEKNYPEAFKNLMDYSPEE